MFKKTIEFHGHELTIETGRLAKQAHGAVLITYGDTQILVTAVADKEAKDVNFLPLSVDYSERKYAAGRMPGGFIKREGRPSTKEILSARLIDRPIRPLFPDGFRCETQVLVYVLSHDGENDADTLGTLGASLALNISDIPFSEPVASVRVARVDGNYIVNPTYTQIEEADLELVVAATKDNIAMIEGEAKEVAESDMIEAVKFGHEAIKELIGIQEEVIKNCAKAKRESESIEYPQGLKEKIESLSKERIEVANKIQIKEDRRKEINQVYTDVYEALIVEDENLAEFKTFIYDTIHDIEKYDVRGRILNEGVRLDGRGLTDIRELNCEVSVLKRTHGSALFTRGQTQALGVTTLGTKSDEQMTDNLEGEKSQSYYLQYNFPPYCTGEVKRVFGVSRREIGHGHLAERSLKPILPSEQSFPYTMRIVSEVMESNGSSSMATICAASMSLMDAGVPIKAPVAGIAMGLIKEGEQVAVLTDILGDEDHLGDMDFKVAGTRDGITAYQMDIKIGGISYDIMEQALIQAQAARMEILDAMETCIPKPKTELSQYAPRILQIKINPDKIGKVIGPGGKQIREIIDQTGVAIDIDDDGIVNIASVDGESAQKAKQIVLDLIAEAEVGKVYLGKVIKVVDFGAFMEILPGIEGLLHISEYEWTKTENLANLIKPGDKFEVKCKGIERGKVSLSRKALLERPVEQKQEEKPDTDKGKDKTKDKTGKEEAKN
ncbi:MAG: polyribonucleotide nucleotidyltransferase [Calditrichaeota bacterium]|nr:polyribonucleotide nucleotidyltransferase [Calditrichota bacterium]